MDSEPRARQGRGGTQAVAVSRIVIAGGGIAGLAAALALHRRAATGQAGGAIAQELVIVERDPAPPVIAPDQAFERWARPGVPQFRHAHILLARLQTILRDEHPELFAALLAAGLELSTLDEVLPAAHVGSFELAPEDRDLLHLWGRRPTFEYVVRRYVEGLPGVRFVHSARIEQLLTKVEADRVEVRGVELTRGGAREALEAEVVIDATGKHTRSPAQLAALGVKVDSVSYPSDRIYVCRHYRLHDAAAAPRRSGTGANLDYFGYATFYAEHGHYAITLSCPIEEQELARHMARASGFDAICAQLPGLAEWTRVSYPTSKVLGAGRFANRWTTCGAGGGLALVGYFAVGDSHIETNPMYGRGCAAAFVQSGALAEVLASTPDVTRRLARYERCTRERMQAHFDFCKQTDDIFRTRGRLSRGEPISRAERTLCYAYDEAWTPAMERSALVTREMLKAMQMRDLSPVGVRLAVLVHIVLSWLSRRLSRVRPVAPQLGPCRPALLRVLRTDGEVSGAHALSALGADVLAADLEADEREEVTALRRHVRQRS